RFEGHIHIILDNLGVKNKFNVIVGPSENRRHKPHPDIYIYTAQKLGVKPGDCIVLEDSSTGVISAKSAGMKVIAIPNKHTKSHDLTKADIITKSLSDIDMRMLNSL
ncbi:MAG TPA: HAD-IA family hydrolase, partial [Xanthomonadales bacterium]|nr:HAD-IA family hydrolase [Xanthomonadales bacterium]